MSEVDTRLIPDRIQAITGGRGIVSVVNDTDDFIEVAINNGEAQFFVPPHTGQQITPSWAQMGARFRVPRKRADDRALKVPTWAAVELVHLTEAREMADPNEYQATFTVVVTKSPLREGWYGRVLVSEDEHLDTNLTGAGQTALAAVQQALLSMTQNTAYVNAILEAALLRGTREAARDAKRLGDGKKR